MKKNKERYKKIIVICHGKSELKLIEHIGTKVYNNRYIHIISKNKGNSSIQIPGLINFLNASLEKELKKIPYDFEKLKIYIIMDTDDCSEEERKRYINKELFKGLNDKTKKFKECIIPIYNTKNLEEVLIKAGCEFKGQNTKAMKKEYLTRIDKIIGNVEKLILCLKKNPNTNLEVLIEELKK